MVISVYLGQITHTPVFLNIKLNIAVFIVDMNYNGSKDQESSNKRDDGFKTSNREFMEENYNNKEETSLDRDLNMDKDVEGCNEREMLRLLESVEDISYNYSYLDHPADVILLGEGDSIRTSLQSVSVSLFNYMSDLSYVDTAHYKKIEVRGRGLLNLLYHLLDECLYLYSSEYFIGKHVLIEEDLDLPLTESVEYFNSFEFNLKVTVLGDYYNKDLHKSGTEIKAITMHYLNFNVCIGDSWYEYKNDMESQEKTEDIIKALKKYNKKITKCKVFCLVDI